MRFAHVYNFTFSQLMLSKSCEFSCRGKVIFKEKVGGQYKITVPINGISIFSHQYHRVIPIRFVLAELCHLLAGRNDLETLGTYSKVVYHYSNDGITMGGAYGQRLIDQWKPIIERLIRDNYSRQACLLIANEDDSIDTDKTHLPCNRDLQFIWRKPLLTLIVESRSSDFVTGFSIDTLHWQSLLVMMANELNHLVPLVDKVAIPQDLIYNIGSLHIYQDDAGVVKQWSVSDKDEFEHFVPLQITLSRAIENCRNSFRGNMTVVELCDLLEINPSGKEVVEKLQELFESHRNKLER